MIRAVVTGGHGYIGGRLVDALRRDARFSVTITSRSARLVPPCVRTIVVNWSNPACYDAICRNHDLVVHLAAMNERDCEMEPEQALLSNGLVTLNLLRAAQSAGVSRFIYVSTSKVFGDNPTGTIDETSMPSPTSHYAITHRVAEDYVLAAHRKRLLQGLVLRLSNCVGPPADPGVNAWTLIANDLCRQAATKGRIVLKGTGLAWRNFIPITDTVSALQHVLTMPTELISDGLFHLGGSASMRIWDLALLIAEHADRLFGQSTETKRPLLNQSVVDYPMFDWRVNRLISTGWSARANLGAEIDGVLRMCREVFGEEHLRRSGDSQ
jgi:UDP-glucose 4-epimerase